MVTPRLNIFFFLCFAQRHKIHNQMLHNWIVKHLLVLKSGQLRLTIITLLNVQVLLTHVCHLIFFSDNPKSILKIIQAFCQGRHGDANFLVRLQNIRHCHSALYHPFSTSLLLTKRISIKQKNCFEHVSNIRYRYLDIFNNTTSHYLSAAINPEKHFIILSDSKGKSYRWN